MNERVLQTGIVIAERDRLILRPFPVIFRRRELLRLSALIAVATILLGGLAVWFLRPHLRFAYAVPAATLVAVFYIYRVTTQVTFVLLRSSSGIYVETRNRLFRTKTLRRLLHRYADIQAVRLRTRLNPNTAFPGVSPMGAYLHYDVVLEKSNGPELLWYTKYPECAALVAETVSHFAGVELLNPENVATLTESGSSSGVIGGA